MNQTESIPAIRVDDVSFHYGDKNVLEHVNMDVTQGSFLGLVGPNGSGKSTLIKCILGLQKPQEGEVYLFGQKVSKFKKWEKVGYVSQKANSFNTAFPATAFEVVSMGLFGKVGLFRFLKSADKQRVWDALESVNMGAYAKKNIGELSGGQQQRIFIARAIVSDPELLILDEPTVGVDMESSASFYNMLKNLHHKRNMTLVLVTHDVGVMTDYVTDVACLNRHIHFHGKTKEFEYNASETIPASYGHHVHVVHHDHDQN
jgi:zinc transport system ATP-binding protein